MRRRLPLLLQTLKMAQPPNLLNAKPSYTGNPYPFSSPNMSKPPKAKKISISISILVMSLPVLYVSLLHVPPNTLFHDTTFWFLISNTIIIIIAADSGVFTPSGDTKDLYDEYVRYSKARSVSHVTGPPVMPSGQESSDVPGRTQELPAVVDDQGQAQEPPALTYETESSDDAEHVQPSLAVADGEESLNDASQVQEPVGLVGGEESFNYERHVPEPPALVGGQDSSDHWRPSRSRSELAVGVRDVGSKYSSLSDEELNPELPALVGGQDSSDHWRPSCSRSELAVRVRDVGSEYSSMSDEELNRRVEEFIRRFKEIRLKEMV